MKRLVLAAVAGLCTVAAGRAQDGYLAPTAPVVPAPVLKNGNLLTPSGGTGAWDTGGSRLFARNNWSPLRTPVAGEPTAYAHPLPPLPAGVGGADGACGSAGCAPRGRDGSCLDKIKAWMCYHPSKTELPKLRPTPYVAPLQGMFPCASGSCGSCMNGHSMSVYEQPIMPLPGQATPTPMPMPVPTGAGAVTMPPRGVQGAAVVQPTWQGRTVPGPTHPGVAGYRYAAPESQSAKPGYLVPAGAKVAK